MSKSGGGDPWAWLGLLKWSLSYSDGTRSSDDISPMSAEDRAFLEKVMAEGIIDENERMKFILQEATKAMDYYKSKASGDENISDPPISDDDLEDLLQELRDIVEQIDYARAFCSLQGLPFLLGCVEERAVPELIRNICTGIISTLCQNNPPVQKQLLELGVLKTLSDVFFSDDASSAMKAKLMQAISSVVRNDEVAENVFCELPQALALFTAGLHPQNSTQQLKSRTLFFFRAFITSDTAKSERVEQFSDIIRCVIDYYLEESTSPDLREMAIAFLEQLLEQNKAVAIIVKRRDELAALGVSRISAMRALTGEEREFAQEELERWEAFMVLLARAK